MQELQKKYKTSKWFHDMKKGSKEKQFGFKMDTATY